MSTTEDIADTKVTISGGGKSVETTVGQMQKAAGVIGKDGKLLDTHASKKPPRKIGSKLANTTGAQLRSFIERIERLEEEKAARGADIREVYAEAKSNGYDPKIMRMVVRIRKMDGNERAEQEAVLDTYLAALGMVQ